MFDYPIGPSDDSDERGQPAGARNDEYLLPQGSDSDWAILTKFTNNRRFRAGETVIAQGDTDRSLYIVTEGELEAVLPQRKGYRQLALFETGSVIGELSFFDGAPRSALVRAVTDAELAMLSPASFDTLAAAHPALARVILFDLGRILAGRLRTAQAVSST
jgi:CRP-like cAMP-binding protein